jgi:hypothetical protein
LRIGIDIRRAPFSVGAPKQNATALDFWKMVGGEGRATGEQDNKKRKKGCARPTRGITQQCRILTQRGSAINFSKWPLNNRSTHPYWQWLVRWPAQGDHQRIGGFVTLWKWLPPAGHHEEYAADGRRESKTDAR